MISLFTSNPSSSNAFTNVTLLVSLIGDAPDPTPFKTFPWSHEFQPNTLIGVLSEFIFKGRQLSLFFNNTAPSSSIEWTNSLDLVATSLKLRYDHQR